MRALPTEQHLVVKLPNHRFGREKGETVGGQIEVIVADSQHIVREALVQLLRSEPDIQVVAEAADAASLLDKIAMYQPQVVTMDLNMPSHESIKVIEKVREQYFDVRVVVLAGSFSRSHVIGLLRAGAAGYLLKDDPRGTLLQAIRSVASGHDWVSPRVAEVLVHNVRNESQGCGALTEREMEVLQWMALGLTNHEIADQLTVSEKTVKNHITQILRKLGRQTRVEAVLHAIVSKIVSIEAIQSVQFDQ